MAYPTFASGDVLTASDMNAVGLWKITSVSATSGTVLNINNCFSSTYDAYRIVLSDFRTAAGASITMQLMVSGVAAATNYTWAFMRADMAGTYVGAGSGTGATTTNWATQLTTSTAPAGLILDLVNPGLAVQTTCFIQSSDNRGITGYGPIYGTGLHSTATAYDGIKFTLSASTFTNVTARVYGYRN